MKNIAIIPARGGSKGIPRKNIRLLNGKPLISYSITAALGSDYIDEVIVSTDDEEIESVALKYGARVIRRPESLATDEVPLDPVIFNVILKLESEGYDLNYIATIQPTSPLIKTETINQVFKTLIDNEYDTVLTAVDDRHLSWGKNAEGFYPRYTERKNRQYLPSEYRETGAVLVSRRNVISEYNRIGKSVSLFEVKKEESIDIDNPTDWWVAEKLLKQKLIAIRVDGYNEIGLGHIYRALTIANHIIDHKVIFLMDERYQLGIDVIRSQNFKIELINHENLFEKISEINPDIIINDILNTTKEYILKLKNNGITVFNFEDLGDGAEFADGVFNALYPGSVPAENFYTGEKYYCARAEFLDAKTNPIRDKVTNVLITFGGTDPNNLTKKTLEAIGNNQEHFEITVIVGPGYEHSHELKEIVTNFRKKINVLQHVKNMAEHMANADIIFSSAGRTMYEIAMVGTPAVIISQNHREMTHLFGHNYNGFINLGLHSNVSREEIVSTFARLLSDKDLRDLMSRRMLKHDLRKGIERVYSIIMSEGMELEK
ncbi:cytidylyltransferase domain-containing protein [Cytobacillus oceanisediminis]|uniref:cytidylyltransferase domain-containing protein n=1 Tax=Cytobacillus oceanisediminis TaxID=665099 RepID=UPI0011A09531|nr:glycosyltransferase [Cytobacillus oceanisediminis]